MTKIIAYWCDRRSDPPKFEICTQDGEWLAVTGDMYKQLMERVK